MEIPEKVMTDIFSLDIEEMLYAYKSYLIDRYKDSSITIAGCIGYKDTVSTERAEKLLRVYRKELLKVNKLQKLLDK